MSTAPTIVHRDLPYARYGARTLLLDLYLPTAGGAGPWPVILWVVGGGWRGASRAWVQSWLTEHGYAVASIDYRVSGEALAPANIHDCKAAVRWLRAHASQYALDATRIGAFGSSAGGHLVALLGLSHGVAALEGDGGHAEHSSAVQAACDFCGPSDLQRIALPEWRSRFALLYEVTEQYLGGPVAERAALAKLVSPLTYARRAVPPLLIVHGVCDDVVPLIESQELYDVLHAAGAPVTLHTLPTAGHNWDVALTRELVVDFFRRTLG